MSTSMFRYCLNPAPEVFASLFGDAQFPHSSLWLLADALHFSAGSLESLVVAAQPERRCALWRLATNARLSESARIAFRAFADCPALITEFLVRCDLCFSQAVQKPEFRYAQTVYADVGWLSSGQWD